MSILDVRNSSTEPSKSRRVPYGSK